MQQPTFSYADFHVDTLSSAENLPLFIDDPSLMTPLSSLRAYQRALIYFAVFTPRSVSDDEGYLRFHKLVAKMRRIRLPENILPILTIEDARILGSDENTAVERLQCVYVHGVRLLTPVWCGESVLGGAHDTDAGLSALGAAIVRNAAKMGILIDVSHASTETTEAIISILNELSFPVVATHSNAFSLCSHTRNLRDAYFDAIVASGGIVGINLYSPFLSEHPATLTDVLRHVEYFCARGGEKSVAIGSDFDGASFYPCGISGVADMVRLYEEMLKHNYSESTVKAIFYDNLKNFTDRYVL